jgi:hypothetical protein
MSMQVCRAGCALMHAAHRHHGCEGRAARSDENTKAQNGSGSQATHSDLGLKSTWITLHNRCLAQNGAA